MQKRVLELGKIRARLLRLAVVVDDDNLVRCIARHARQAGEAAGQQIDAVAHRYDNRDFFCFPEWPFDPIGMRRPVDRDMSRLLSPLQMRLEREPAGLERARLSPDIVRG